MLAGDPGPGPALVASLAEARPAARVEATGSAEAALTLVGHGPPSLVLVDLRLPAEEWQRFLAGLDRPPPRAPVVGLTGETDSETVLDAEGLGVVAFVPAPVERGTLAEVLGRLLDGTREDATEAP